MTRADLVPAARDEDTKLIAELRRLLDEAVRQLAGWEQSAKEALHTAETVIATNKALYQLVAELEVEVESLRCGDLVAFSDGELEQPRADKFRAHLARCAGCRQTLVESETMDAVLASSCAARQPKEG